MPKTLKTCPICYSNVTGLSKSPNSCTDPITNEPITHLENESSSTQAATTTKKACSECWEAYISTKIESLPLNHPPPSTKDPQKSPCPSASSSESESQIQCLFCPSHLNTTSLQRLSYTATFKRYQLKTHTNTTFQCQNRCLGSNTPFQPFVRERDGRVFTCALCGFATCTDCDVPEHEHEHATADDDIMTCEVYQARLRDNLVHRTSEDLISQNFLRCPNCSVPVTIDKGCGYVQCVAGKEMTEAGVTGGCGYRFCSRCLIPWVGEGSDYLGGCMQHSEGCRYFKKAGPSMRSLKRRFDYTSMMSEGKDAGGGGHDVGTEERKAKVKFEDGIKAEGS